MPPVVSIVGKSETGKTTFLEKLIRELTSRGHRVATIKHTHHDQAFAPPGKDTLRHLQAGSETTVLTAPNGVSIVKPFKQQPNIDDVARLLGDDYDIVLTEGFSRGEAPKIEVHRKGVGTLLKTATKRFAIVTDEPLDTKVRQFDIDDVKGVADLLEEGFINPNKERLTLFVNNTPIPLSEYPRGIMTNVILGMAAALKGVGEVKTLQLFLKREPKKKAKKA